ncbi:Choline transport system permease protein OpuBB [Sporomusa ovata DSM 2662]|uniref:L-proline glycine betaine binding ABC transporter protein ProX (TC 3.A.1.12.1) / Osmotic adaptation n=1 Tax=Sporomusa ovata TaxID=2378 RepID=A0A0U1KXA1_9FIRM|nr:ABC transporter permease [Sporomusa ovata]EQB28357.1 choline transport system permease protein OpuBB [Sporomusa ovata DSM 2662]CQR71996.1 L-proline glycine betaine binding ABC transporter protein ProX (TC 3.A.1.12.1) / Osmotic adaptation [Sporomusa ovata]
MLQYICGQWQNLLAMTVDHIIMSAVAIVIAVTIGITLGIASSKVKWLARPVLLIVNTIQTIPALAMFGLLMPVVGIGSKAGIIALILYAILPIVKNTYTGITGIDRSMSDAGHGLGMTEFQMLKKVELPLAMPVIMAGIRTSAVLTVGLATIVALIGGSGLGKIVYQGISRVDNIEIMIGALLAVALSVAVDLLFGKMQARLNWRARRKESAGDGVS